MAIQLFNVGVKAAAVQEGRILLVKHATKGFWDVPGGRIDDNESIEETLEREIGEELPNAKLRKIDGFVCAYRVPDLVLDNGGGLVLLVHAVELEFPEGLIEISDEHSEARWVSFDEARDIGSHIVRHTVNALDGERVA